MEGIVPMRMKTGDCVIAAVASALQRPYEEIAAKLGVALDSSGVPVAESFPWPRDNEPLATLTYICERLRSLGAVLIAQLPPAFIETIVAASQSPAILIVNSYDPIDCGLLHALAYRDGRVIDCRGERDMVCLGVCLIDPLAALVFLPESAEVSDTLPAHPRRDSAAAMKKATSTTTRTISPIVSVLSKTDCTADCA